MLKKLKNLSEIKKELKFYLNNKDVYDLILFGSFVKGKVNPGDLDIALISDKELKEIEGFHISFIKPIDFFINIPSLATTLLREGFSLKHNKPFSEVYGFKNSILFSYNLKNVDNVKKVKIVNFLRGKKGENGLVAEQKGRWIGNGLFIVDINKDYLFDEFFTNHKIKFKKSYILIH
jgi:predicted nucleotidyltransferase